ncbi:hypothetical protein HOK51_01095 [Candidatus Woesearchaeota archaeon]|jgi:hypothetical protein|nr:hypothetical protein [Candidatus Woesearchaeota archaeon]MBT7366592.1 hypothetical protein [Candidatus Woesearchaeota archaeon]
MEEKKLLYWIFGISIAVLIVSLIILYLVYAIKTGSSFPPMNGGMIPSGPIN